MKIGLFFGSFNPIHNGHLAIARYIIENCGMDKLWFVISPHNPLKNRECLIDDKLRFELVKLSIAGNDRFEACDVEFNLAKPSYTISTLDFLQLQYPDYEFYLIMGADNFVNLEKWKDYQRIIGEYRFLVYPRPAFDINDLKLKVNFTMIHAPLMDISSTSIREAIREQQDVSNLIPPATLGFIMENNLYRD